MVQNSDYFYSEIFLQLCSKLNVHPSLFTEGPLLLYIFPYDSENRAECQKGVLKINEALTYLIQTLFSMKLRRNFKLIIGSRVDFLNVISSEV